MPELTFLGEYGIIIYAMKLGNAQFAKPPFAFAGGGLVHQRASEIPEVPGRLSRRNTKYRGERIPMDKPFLTLDEQVNRLKSRGLLVDTRTRWILEREGYYSVVNGYKWPFLDEGRAPRPGMTDTSGARLSMTYIVCSRSIASCGISCSNTPRLLRPR